MAQLGGHLLGIPKPVGIHDNPSCHSSGTCTPVTSGAEELLDDEKCSRTPPPDLNTFFERRWSKLPRSTDTEQADVDVEAGYASSVIPSAEPVEAAQSLETS